jgi:predicted O-methyltransferase YrrM
MAGYGKLIFKNIGKAFASPGTAIKLVWRRLFPFGIIPKDPEAYRIGSWSYGKLKRLPLPQIFPGIEQVDAQVYKVYDRDITTSVDPAEILALCSIVKHRNAKSIVEVGTFNGNTALNLAANSAEDASIATIDLPPDWNGKYEIKVPEIYVNVTERSSVGSHYKSYPEFAKKITQVFGDSAGLDWSKLKTPFDLVFIDGNHHYNYVLSDTENALKHLAKNGVIVWHDYGMIEDVSKVVDQYEDRMHLYVIRGTRMAVGWRK